jgi:hypothetical protein
MVRRKPDNRFFTETRNFSGEAASLINERDEQRRAAGSREIAPNRLCVRVRVSSTDMTQRLGHGGNAVKMKTRTEPVKGPDTAMDRHEMEERQ